MQVTGDVTEMQETGTDKDNFDSNLGVVADCPALCTCGKADSTSLNMLLHTVDCSNARLKILSQFDEHYHVTKPGISEYNPSRQVILPEFSKNLNFMQQLKLTSNEIEILPASRFKNLTSVLSLDLSDNKLRQLGESDFEGLVNVLSINLTRNCLKIINPATFKYTPKLLHLYLTHNFLNYIHAEWFSSIPNLEQLFVAQNGIASLKERTFSTLMGLLTLSLADNHLESLDKFTFIGLTRLEHLDLSGNQLKTVPSRAISILNSLHDLKLDNNAIHVIGAYDFDSLNLYALSINNMPSLTAIEKDAFLSLSILQRLEISRNPNLAYISPDAIRDVPRLNLLYLSDNNLKAIPSKLIFSLTALKTLAVHGNPLKCDCNVRWLRKCLEQQDNDIIKDNPVEREDDAIDRPFDRFLTVIRVDDILCPIGTQKWLPNSGTTTSAVHIRGQPLIQIPLESIPEKCSPTIVPSFLQSYNYELGTPLSLTCYAIGIPRPNIHWILPSGKIVNNTSNNSRIRMKAPGNIVIDHIKIFDAGTYICSATSPQGYSTQAATLKIHSKDVHLMFKGVATNFVTVTWNNTDATLSTSNYVILYRAPATEKAYRKVPIQPYMRAYTFTQLKPQTNYEFCIAYEKLHNIPSKINCIQVTTKHNMYLMAGIKSVHNVTLIITICVGAAVITISCVLFAVCRNYCKRKEYSDPTWGGDKYFTSTNKRGDYSDSVPQIPLENFYTSPTTPLASTPLCSSTTSLISNIKT